MVVGALEHLSCLGVVLHLHMISYYLGGCTPSYILHTCVQDLFIREEVIYLAE